MPSCRSSSCSTASIDSQWMPCYDDDGNLELPRKPKVYNMSRSSPRNDLNSLLVPVGNDGDFDFHPDYYRFGSNMGQRMFTNMNR